jgi:hypothetical protein
MYRKLTLVLGAALLGTAATYISAPTLLDPWIAQMDDTLWWPVLPWALLAVLWIVLGVGVARELRSRGEAGGSEAG